MFKNISRKNTSFEINRDFVLQELFHLLRIVFEEVLYWCLDEKIIRIQRFLKSSHLFYFKYCFF